MKCGLIGAGRVGTAFFFHLKKTGVKISGIYDIDRNRVLRAESILGKKFYRPFPDLIRESDIIFIATPDSEISKVYHQSRPYLKPGSTLFHFSGSTRAKILRRKDVYQGSLHPLGTFPDYQSYRKIKSYYFGLEGDKRAVATAERILKNMGIKYFVLRSKKKIIYHLASVFSSNLLIGLLAIAESLARRCNLRKDEFTKFFGPLISGAIDDIKTKGLVGALSGPVERGDLKTIKSHLKILASIDRRYLEIYRLISREILRLTEHSRSSKIYRLLDGRK